MNLNAIVSGAVGAVNPRVPLSLQVSQGSTVGADFKPVPSYAPAVTVMGQVQPMTWRDIQMTDGLNLTGTRRVIYLDGNFDGIVRVSAKGGDLISTPSGEIYLVAMVLETWPDFCKVAATLQDGS
jgi:hypothetical protein